MSFTTTHTDTALRSNTSAPAERRITPTTKGPDILARTRVYIRDIELGGNRFVVIAGPCAIESETQIHDAAALVAAHGAHILRGGAFKARTSPYTFQGLGLDGVKLMREAADRQHMPMITEVLSERDIEGMVDIVDAFQVGSRNMDNTALLKELGQTKKPVLLKRGFAATIKEWLLAAEYIIVGGNDQVVLCERGIRTFSNETRFTLDLAGAVLARQQTHLPVIVDPSHATGNPSLIPALAAATMAAGLDGLMVEVHPDPTVALSDADQALSPELYRGMMEQLHLLATVMGRPLT
ncbi:MAG: 3-deoxy-7-phosphoheptulonate synthase [Bacteroidetes bacterium]|nr:3-deoxy-7-phosphoheptulonate synthase [Bacteroidota bacterium]